MFYIRGKYVNFHTKQNKCRLSKPRRNIHRQISLDKPINDIKDNLIGVQEMVQELPDCEIGKLSETCNFIANKIKNIRYELERLKMV